MITQHTELIKEIVVRIKNNPTMTLTQYNSFLATKPWYEQTIIRFFIYKMSVGLAQHHGVSITDYTESKVLQKVRDWIVETPERKLSKIILGNVNNGITE